MLKILDLIFTASSLALLHLVFSALMDLVLSVSWTFLLHGNAHPDSLPPSLLLFRGHFFFFS